MIELSLEHLSENEKEFYDENFFLENDTEHTLKNYMNAYSLYITLYKECNVCSINLEDGITYNEISLSTNIERMSYAYSFANIFKQMLKAKKPIVNLSNKIEYKGLVIDNLAVISDENDSLATADIFVRNFIHTRNCTEFEIGKLVKTLIEEV